MFFCRCTTLRSQQSIEKERVHYYRSRFYQYQAYKRDYYNCIKIQADGKAVLGGGSGGNDTFGTTMGYLADGTSDNNFCINGVVEVNYLVVADLVIQADGKIVVGSTLGLFVKRNTEDLKHLKS